VLALIEDPARDWSLDELASLAGASRATLVRDFRRLADTTPLAFLTDLRLDLTCQALGQTDRALADIALDVGYQSQSALSRAFQRRFGMAPSAMRRGPDRTSPVE
jgi:AraC family transcriptional regulator, activator of mtrCDE